MAASPRTVDPLAPSDGEPPAPPPPARRAVAAAIIALMAFGSVALWIGIPVLWLWIGSKLQESTDPRMGPYLLVLAGIIASMIAVAKLLSRLNALYERLTGRSAHVRVQLPWMKSMRGERTSGRPRTVLDVVMVISVLLALTVFGIWFVFFAGAPF